MTQITDPATSAGEIVISSIVSAHTKEPMVNLTIGSRDVHIQLTIEESLSLARHIMSAANAAKMDAFVVSWLRDEINMPDGSFAAVLELFREWRKKRGEPL